MTRINRDFNIMKINVVFEITMNTCSYNKGRVGVEIWVEGEKVTGKVGENVIYATMPTIRAVNESSRVEYLKLEFDL